MVRINRIYTRNGDDGSTGLVGGTRIDKDNLRVEAYGDVDELNSWLGLIRTIALRENLEESGAALAILQNELFDLGALLASPPGHTHPSMPGISSEQTSRLEAAIDHATSGLPELTSFVLPGGTELNAMLHIARTVCRRAERHVVALSRKEEVAPEWIAYLNRLSDLLFALARQESFRAGQPEYLWKPGKRTAT